jgi:hypothetical protein
MGDEPLDHDPPRFGHLVGRHDADFRATGVAFLRLGTGWASVTHQLARSG